MVAVVCWFVPQSSRLFFRYNEITKRSSKNLVNKSGHVPLPSELGNAQDCYKLPDRGTWLIIMLHLALKFLFPFVLISLQNKEQNNESQFFFIDRQIMHNLLIYNPTQPQCIFCFLWSWIPVNWLPHFHVLEYLAEIQIVLWCFPILIIADFSWIL